MYLVHSGGFYVKNGKAFIRYCILVIYLKINEAKQLISPIYE
jgi:hypothetical protein